MTLGVSVLWAELDDERYQEIHLQGDYTFAGIIAESERQLGVKIQIPLQADDDLTSSYNQIISLRQLVDAIVVHFGQDDVPLDYHFEAKRLKFSRRDVVARATQRSSQISRPKYPVPVLSEPEPSRESPRLPTWATPTPKPSRSPVALSRREELPTLSRSGVQRETSARPTPELQIDDLESPSGSSSTFSVSIPQKRQTVVMSPSQPSPRNGQQPLPQYNRNSNPVPLARSMPSSSSRLSPQGDARSDSFGITPYPQDAVAFINDAPSIVPGAARENYIEWKTRMDGALQNGHRSALKNEQKDLERRLLWLRSQLK